MTNDLDRATDVERRPETEIAGLAEGVGLGIAGGLAAEKVFPDESTPKMDQGTPASDKPDKRQSRDGGSREDTPRIGRRRRSSSNKGAESRSSSVAEESVDPSSPSQIYRNILIVEESLRRQYIAMAISRRKHVLFLSILVISSIYYTYAVLIDPSIYRIFNLLDRLMLMGSIITLGLFHLTGMYTKTFIYEPRFVYNLNKGLRPFNMKMVKVKKTWAEYLLGLVYSPSYMTRPGRLVKVVLSTRTFTSDTIESWELYRQDYWEREYERSLRINERKAKTKHSPSLAAGPALKHKNSVT